jgi:hypothetical protein
VACPRLNVIFTFVMTKIMIYLVIKYFKAVKYQSITLELEKHE